MKQHLFRRRARLEFLKVLRWKFEGNCSFAPSSVLAEKKIMLNFDFYTKHLSSRIKCGTSSLTLLMNSSCNNQCYLTVVSIATVLMFHSQSHAQARSGGLTKLYAGPTIQFNINRVEDKSNNYYAVQQHVQRDNANISTIWSILTFLARKDTGTEFVAGLWRVLFGEERDDHNISCFTIVCFNQCLHKIPEKLKHRFLQCVSKTKN